jgi:hypothetical protein
MMRNHDDKSFTLWKLRLSLPSSTLSSSVGPTPRQPTSKVGWISHVMGRGGASTSRLHQTTSRSNAKKRTFILKLIQAECTHKQFWLQRFHSSGKVRRMCRNHLDLQFWAKRRS